MVMFGATAMPGRDTDATVAAFGDLILYMRDFGKDGPDDDALPELPPHGAGKWLAKPSTCLLHVSWKDDVDELITWLDGLHEDVWLTVWHEPMGDVTPAAYRATATRAVEIIQAHPNGHHVVRNGPVVTRYWLVHPSKNGNPLDWWYDGANLYGIDFYNDSTQAYRTSEDLFDAALAKVRAAVPGVKICIPEFGLALIGNDDGTQRAQRMRAHAAHLRKQPDVIAVSWWDIGGNRITGRPLEQTVWREILEETTTMPDPRLTPALRKLRDQINARWPRRDRRSDGDVGDAAHAARPSDHNPDETGTPEVVDADRVDEIHAIDVDADLDPAGPGAMERLVQTLVGEHRAGRENRLRYVIYRRRIWSASQGWRERPYSGDNPHDQHAHLSGSYASAREADTSPWTIEEETMSKANVLDALDDAVPWVSSGVRNQATAAGWGESISTRALLEYLFAASVLSLPGRLAELLAAINADPGNTITLDPAQVGELAGLLAAQLPTPPSAEQVADAVVDEHAARLGQ